MVSIVIVNFNTRALLLECIESIYRKSPKDTFEILVVDNASVDDSVSALRAKYPEVRVLPQERNLGFGRANNVGAQAARGEYLLMLNSDTLFLNDVVGSYVTAYNGVQHANPGAVGAILLDRDHKFTHSYGWYPRMHDEVFHRLGLRALPKEDLSLVDGRPRKVEYLTGAALFIRTADFLAVGGFHQDFFMYYEDNELQYRLAKTGKRSYLVDGPQILHLVGQSIERSNVRRTFTAVSKVTYYRLTTGMLASLVYRLCFSLLEVFLVLLDVFRRKPNYTPEENLRFLACLGSGSLRYLRRQP